MERRKAPRFAVQLRCFITPTGARTAFLLGVCENLSRIALFVRIQGALDSSRLPKAGDYLEVDVELPGRLDAVNCRSLHSLVTVSEVRTGDGGEIALVMAVHQMQFRDLPSRFRSMTAAVRQDEAVM